MKILSFLGICVTLLYGSKTSATESTISKCAKGEILIQKIVNQRTSIAKRILPAKEKKITTCMSKDKYSQEIDNLNTSFNNKNKIDFRKQCTSNIPAFSTFLYNYTKNPKTTNYHLVLNMLTSCPEILEIPHNYDKNGNIIKGKESLTYYENLWQNILKIIDKQAKDTYTYKKWQLHKALRTHLLSRIHLGSLVPLPTLHSQAKRFIKELNAFDLIKFEKKSTKEKLKFLIKGLRLLGNLQAIDNAGNHPVWALKTRHLLEKEFEDSIAQIEGSVSYSLLNKPTEEKKQYISDQLRPIDLAARRALHHKKGSSEYMDAYKSLKKYCQSTPIAYKTYIYEGQLLELPIDSYTFNSSNFDTTVKARNLLLSICPNAFFGPFKNKNLKTNIENTAVVDIQFSWMLHKYRPIPKNPHNYYKKLLGGVNIKKREIGFKQLKNRVIHFLNKLNTPEEFSKKTHPSQISLIKKLIELRSEIASFSSYNYDFYREKRDFTNKTLQQQLIEGSKKALDKQKNRTLIKSLFKFFDYFEDNE